MDYPILIEELTQSYSRQIEWYTKLETIVQKILGQVVLSRGDFSTVMGLFEEKKRLLETITQERESMKNNVEIWQKEKSQIPPSESTAKLNAVLSDAERAIKTFLDTENQLKKYLEHNMVGKGNNSNE